MGVNSLPKTVTRQRRDCDLNPGPSAPESSTLTTRLPSHPTMDVLSLFISVLCHSNWLVRGESCPRLDVVHPGRAWSPSPACTWHCTLHYLFLQATPLFPRGVTIVLVTNRKDLFTAAEMNWTPVLNTRILMEAFTVHWTDCSQSTSWRWRAWPIACRVTGSTCCRSVLFSSVQFILVRWLISHELCDLVSSFCNRSVRNTQDDSDVISIHIYARWFSPLSCG